MKRVFAILLLVGGCSDTQKPCPAVTGGADVLLPAQPQPTFGQTVSQAAAPPALSGGTLLILSDGKTAVASDPDRDQVYVIDLSARKLRSTIALTAGDEPGRLVADANGHVHLSLRRGGAIVDIDPIAGTLLGRRVVCPAPRGIAYEAATDLLHVACTGGELISLPAAGGSPTRTVMLEQDLRDVLIQGDHLVVSKFREATLLILNADGTIASRETPQPFVQQAVAEPLNDTEEPASSCGSTGRAATTPHSNVSPVTFTPAIAWRAITSPTGDVVMVHQRGATTPVQVTTGGYGGFGECAGIVHATVTTFGSTPTVAAAALAQVVLPLDIAISPDGTEMAILSAGNAHGTGSQLIQTPIDDTSSPQQCTFGNPRQVDGEVIALAYHGDTLIVQSREPAQLQIIAVDGNSTPDESDTIIRLSTLTRADTGHAIFHSNSGAGIACASCHAEGGEDGRVWNFVGTGNRRTQSLRGGIMGTEPFHWDGEEANLDAIMTDVFQGRMSGPPLATDQTQALSGWLNAIPLLPNEAPVDPDAVTRGQALFQSAEVGCAGCHSGAKLTDNVTIDVGTGGAFQVPSLRGLKFRAPYIHSGCATTLADRFGTCGGANHGQTSQLTAAQKQDLITYLETL